MDDRVVDDREGVEAVLLRYGAELDARHADGVLSCFTDDARLEYFNGELVMNGVEEARGFFDFGRSGGLPGLDRIIATTHLWSVGAVAIAGDLASARTSCVAYLLGSAGGDGILVIRGLHYDDDLQRLPAGWRIRHRRHHPDWETRVPATSPHLPEQRT